MRTNKFIKIAFVLMTGLFCFSMTHLFLLRFKSGDIYPPYSSFRADPLGTKALFDSLTHLNGPEVTRNFAPSEQIKDAQETCIIVSGFRSGSHLFIAQKEYDHINRLINSGCRLVIGLTPIFSSYTKDPSSKTDNPTSKAPKKKTDESTDPKPVDLYEKLGVNINHTRFKQKKMYASPSLMAIIPESFSPTPWPQGFWFEPVSPNWDIIYSIQSSEPVIIQKKSGKGSIVLLADSYLFSNESLKAHNNSELLTWLFDNKPHIMFDEYHLGVQKQPGISSLIKKYQLYGPIGLFILVVILIIWKLSACLIPPDEQEELMNISETESQNGLTKNHISGLTSLLKQHIPKKDIINQCIAAWKNTFVLENLASKKYAQKYQKIQSTIPLTKKKNREVDTYIRICHILFEKETS